MNMRTSPVVWLITVSRPPGGMGQPGADTVSVPAAGSAVMVTTFTAPPLPPPVAAVVKANA